MNVALVGTPIPLAAAPVIVNKMDYDKVTSGWNVSRDELEQKGMSVDKDTIKGGSSHTQIVEGGVAPTRMSFLAPEGPETEDGKQSDKAVGRGVVTHKAFKNDRNSRVSYLC